MKAMILAAGKGTRVAPFTINTPKPLLKVLGEPVIDHIIGFLKRNQVDDIVINTSYLGDKIQDYLGDGSRHRVSMTYSYEGFKSSDELINNPLGSAGGLREIQKKYRCFNETFLVLCGDAIIDFDLDYALTQHKANKSMATVILKEVPKDKVSAYGVVDMLPNGQIKRFQEKPTPEEAVSNQVSTGIYIFEPEVFDFIPKSGEYDIGGQLLPALAEQGHALFGCATPMQWIDIGNVFDLWQANLLALYQQINHFPQKGTEVKPGIFLGKNVQIDLENTDIQGPVYIGSGTIVEPGATITGPVIISENCHIEENAQINNCVLSPYTRLLAESDIKRTWLSGDFTIDLTSPSTCVAKQLDPCVARDVRVIEEAANVEPLTRRA